MPTRRSRVSSLLGPLRSCCCLSSNSEPRLVANDSMLARRQTFVLQDAIADLLYHVLTKKLPHSIKFTELPDNYLLLDEILLIPEFREQNCQYQDLVDAIHGDEKLRFSIRGSKVRLKPPELNKDRNVIISKKMAWILRHGAAKAGLKYAEGGFLYVDEILRLPTFNGITAEDLRRIVEWNDKKRYELVTESNTNRLKIRAFQGHSVHIEGLELTPIKDPSAYPAVIHGTYYRNWPTIQAEGLKRMTRTHIHFVPGECPEDGVISGMRKSAELLIFINLPEALKDGIEFFISENHVVLTPGDEKGCLPVKYIKEVRDRKTGEVIYPK